MVVLDSMWPYDTAELLAISTTAWLVNEPPSPSPSRVLVAEIRSERINQGAHFSWELSCAASTCIRQIQ